LPSGGLPEKNGNMRRVEPDTKAPGIHGESSESEPRIARALLLEN
jgi:hypothetical protein